ncbi:MAG: response regulator [Treponema sp.]|nr:response regulator [Treponema sp.]
MDFIRVMLVDDEPIVLEDLSDLLDWEQAGFRIVGTARNGKNALEKMEALRPELIISDIKMPVIDGVQLAAELKKRKSGSLLVLISSWAEFEYARSAIKYGVQDYVLKNDITKEKLVSLLETCKQKILHVREENKVLLSLYIQNLFSEKYHENIPSAGMENKYFETENFYSLIISADTPVGIFRSRASERPVLGRYADSVYRMADKNIRIKAVEEIDRGVLLVLLEDIKKNGTILQELFSFAEQLKVFLKEETGQSFSSFYFPEAQPLKKTAGIYIHNKSVLQCSLFDGEGGQYNLEDKTLRTYSGMAFVDVTDILQFFRSGSREQLYYSVKGLTVQLKKLRNTEALFMCSSQLYAGIAEYIREHPPLQNSLLKDSAVQEAFYSVSGVFDFFLKIMTACISEITGNDEKKYSQATRKSIEYIRENYSDKSLGVRPIAENVGLSANRLMFVFKQDTGYTLSSYLTRYRVEKGKEFLQEKSFKIYEIADRTGFSSSQYFSQVFYRITGKTPLDWRDRK